jgi:hypothetical protein
MTTLDNALKDAKTVAEISKRYEKYPLFQGLVAHFAGENPKRTVKKSVKKAAKKVAKAAPKKTAKPRGKKGEWPAKIRAVLQEMSGASASDIIQALGFEKDKAKSAHVRTVLSSLKKQGKIAATDGKYSNIGEVLVPTTGPTYTDFGNAEAE